MLRSPERRKDVGRRALTCNAAASTDARPDLWSQSGVNDKYKLSIGPLIDGAGQEKRKGTAGCQWVRRLHTFQVAMDEACLVHVVHGPGDLQSSMASVTDGGKYFAIPLSKCLMLDPVCK